MTRSRKTAKDAGSRFAQCIADGLAALLDDDRIERRTERGALDRGDIAAVRDSHGRRIVVECKDHAGRLTDIPEALREAEAERINDGAHAGIVALKRRGIGYSNPSEQLVIMTLEQLGRILTPPEAPDA